MTTHVDQTITDVIPEPEPLAAEQGGAQGPGEEERIHGALSRIRHREARLSAEGFDD